MRAVTDPFPPLVLSALATFLSAIQTAPRELRSSLSTLDLTIPDLFTHPSKQIRHAAAELYSQLLIVKPQAAVQPAFEHLLHFVTARMDDVHHLLERFTSAPIAPRRLHSDVLAMSAAQMAHYYEVLCRILCAMLRLSARVAVPAAPLVHSLLGGLAYAEIDSYASVKECVLDADGALWMGSCVVREALGALKDVIQKLGRALLPYARIMARGVERRLARGLLRFRKEGGIVGCEERRLTYELIGVAVEVLGSVFMERVLEVFAEVFEMEAVFYGKSLESARRKVEKVSIILESGKRKRKRHGRQVVEESVEEAEMERTADSVGVAIMGEVEKCMEEGLGVCIAVFDNRGMLSDKAVESLEKLELILTRLAAEDVTDKLLEAMRAAALGGGASRVRAEASPLLLQCAEEATKLMLAGTLGKRKKVVLQTRSACEIVFHPRGPPLLRPMPDKVLSQVTEFATPGKLQKDLVNIGNQIIVKNDERNSSDSGMILESSAPSNIPNGSLQRQREGSIGVPEVEHRQQDRTTNASQGNSVRNKDDNTGKGADTSSLRPSQEDILVEKRVTTSKTVLKPVESEQIIVESEQLDKNGVQVSSPIEASPPLMPKTNAAQNQQRCEEENNSPLVNDDTEDEGRTNRVENASKDEKAGENERELTSEAEEQALIASLRFEPPDEE